MCFFFCWLSVSWSDSFSDLDTRLPDQVTKYNTLTHSQKQQQQLEIVFHTTISKWFGALISTSLIVFRCCIYVIYNVVANTRRVFIFWDLSCFFFSILLFTYLSLSILCSTHTQNRQIVFSTSFFFFYEIDFSRASKTYISIYIYICLPYWLFLFDFLGCSNTHSHTHTNSLFLFQSRFRRLGKCCVVLCRRARAMSDCLYTHIHRDCIIQHAHCGHTVCRLFTHKIH